jgi:hypothetical protein
MIHKRGKSKYLLTNLPHLHFNYHKSHTKSLESIPKHSLIDISDIRAFVYNVVKFVAASSYCASEHSMFKNYTGVDEFYTDSLNSHDSF